MRIYITKMRFRNEEEDKKIYKKAYALISALNEQEHETVYVGDDEFKDYEGIYKAILSCNCLLAFTDAGTTSSTWRASEMTYAYDGVGAFEKVDFHIPMFLYRAIDDHNSMFLDSFVKRPEVYTLPDDTNSAVQLINTIMKEKQVGI